MTVLAAAKCRIGKELMRLQSPTSLAPALVKAEDRASLRISTAQAQLPCNLLIEQARFLTRIFPQKVLGEEA